MALIYLILAACFVILSSPLLAKISDPVEYLSAYDRATVDVINPLIREQVGEGMLEKIELLLQSKSQDAQVIFLLQRMKIKELYNQGKYDDFRQACDNFDMKPDDFELQTICIIGSGRLSNAEKIQAVRNIFQKSLKESKGKNVATRVAIKLLNLALETNDVALTREIYQQALETVPSGAKRSKLDLKWNAANIYSNSYNSRKTQLDSLRIYDELELAFREDGDSQNFSEYIIFNKAQTYLVSLDDYVSAIGEYDKIPRSSEAWLSALVYKSWAYLQLGRSKDARAIIETVDLSQYTDMNRLSELRCYQSMVLFELGLQQNIKACTSFSEVANPETVHNVTRALMKKNLSEDDELQILRKFWLTYERHISPQIKTANENYTDSLELMRVRSENQVKDLELKNFNFLKLFFAFVLLALLGAILMIRNLRTKHERIKKLQSYIRETVLSRFLPPVLVEEIVQGRSRIEAEPKEELVTLIFCDIVGFTALSGTLGVKKTAEVLNHFMQAVTEVIYRHHGTIDKFIGDAVMIVFGAPTPLSPEVQAQRAMACALDLMASMKHFNVVNFGNSAHEIKLRIGINQGIATVGIFGSEKRSDFTAIGPSVNLASRIESLANPNEILISESMSQHLSPDVMEDRGWFHVRGIDQQVRLFRLKEKMELAYEAG